MKKTVLLLVILLGIGINFNTRAESSTKHMKNGEQIFLKHSDECLAIIEKEALKANFSGVAIIAFIPGDATESWVSKMKVVGRLASDKANFLAIAYAKASEMAVTLKDSGNHERKEIFGELGFQGGVIQKVNSGYLVAAFSGGSSQQDADASKVGLDWLSEQY